MDSIGLLSNIKVVELEGYLPICFLGKMLYDLGADVTLVTNQKSIDIMSVLKHLNEGKKTIKLDLKIENENEIFLKLIAKADILLESYRPSILEKLNLVPKELLKVNPKLIIVRLTG